MRLFINSISNQKGVEPSVLYDVSKCTALHAPSPLVTPTPDLSGQVVHPKVLYFDDGWNGWKYWQAVTGYTNGNDQTENPQILVSNDGDTWQIPDGLTNPLDGPPNPNYYADTDLILGYDNKLYCVWRYFLDLPPFEYYIYMQSSSDGVNWSSTSEIWANDKGGLSPAFIKENDKYYFWEIGVTTDPVEMTRWEGDSMDGPFTNNTLCVVDNLPSGEYPWHLDVIKIKGYYYTLLDLYDGTGGGSGANLWIGSSPDGINWTLGDNVLMDKSANGNWDDDLIYRSTMVFVDGVQPRFDIWYSARSTSNVWREGRTFTNLYV